jgi:hypothetical protein
MRISRVLKVKTTSISGNEIDLFTARRHHESLRMKYVKEHNSLFIHVLLPD